MYGRLDIVRLLLTEGADMTIADDDGWTALHWASMDGHLDIVNCLRKWPCTMAIIILQELALYYQPCINLMLRLLSTCGST